ncbi:unnamed protein product [Moneuplotes crassus]|uniref:Uncharacterized protein n=1 Tax=Euplotes crassus TaxID=5936 RepID=A0AAD1Y314_EUPCR|nr:unnamed protein product [Moneuplotes crassus]
MTASPEHPSLGLQKKRKGKWTGEDLQLRVLDVDQMLDEAGGLERWNWAFVGLGVLWAGVASQGFTMYGYNSPLLELVPKLECKQDDQWVECRKQDICINNQMIDSELWRPDFTDKFSFRNWMTEFQLYCYPDFWIGLLGSVFLIGIILNGIVLKQADYFGRKSMLIYTSIGHIILSMAMFYSTNIYANYVILFFGGMLYSKNYLAYIYCVEITPEKHRIFFGCILLTLEAILPRTSAVLYLYFADPEGRDLNKFHILATVFSLLSLALCMLIPESPKYLYEKKRWKELREVISSIANFNNVKMDETYLIKEEEKGKSDTQRLLTESPVESAQLNLEASQKQKIQSKEAQGNEFSVINELKNARTLINFICVASLFCIGSFTYQLLGFYLKYAGGDIYVNTLVACISETLGNFSVSFVQRAFGTKLAFLSFFIIVLIFPLPLLVTTDAAIVAISIFGCRFFLVGIFTMCYFANSQYFPALFAPFAFSVCSMVAHILSCLGPEVAEIKPESIPVFVLLTLIMSGIIITLLLQKPTEKTSETLQK